MAKDEDKARDASSLALEAALEWHFEELKASPDNAATWVQVADLHRDLGRSEQAIEIYSWAARKYALEGQLLPAVAAVKAILALDPRHRETQQALGRLYGTATRADRDRAVREVVSETVELRRGAASRLSPKPPRREDELFSRIAGEDRFETEWILATETRDGLAALVARLPEVPLFSRLADDEFHELVEKSRLQRFAAGSIVTAEGEAGDAFYVITAGRVRITKRDAAGHDVELGSEGRGEFFGELAFFSGAIRTATVTADAELEVLVIDRQVLAELLRTVPEIRAQLLRHYGERLVSTVLRISPLFQVLDEADRRRLVPQFEYVDVPTGTALIRQGEMAEGFFVVLEGEVAVSERTIGGGAEELAKLREGEFFGEIGFLSGLAATASCVTLRAAKLFRLSRARFGELVNEHPRLLELLSAKAHERLERSITKGLLSNSSELAKSGLV